MKKWWQNVEVLCCFTEGSTQKHFHFPLTSQEPQKENTCFICLWLFCVCLAKVNVTTSCGDTKFTMARKHSPFVWVLYWLFPFCMCSFPEGRTFNIYSLQIFCLMRQERYCRSHRRNSTSNCYTAKSRHLHYIKDFLETFALRGRIYIFLTQTQARQRLPWVVPI